MSGYAFGSFSSGLTGGLQTGLQLGGAIKKGKQEGEERDNLKKANEEVAALFEADTGNTETPQTQMPPPVQTAPGSTTPSAPVAPGQPPANQPIDELGQLEQASKYWFGPLPQQFMEAAKVYQKYGFTDMAKDYRKQAIEAATLQRTAENDRMTAAEKKLFIERRFVAENLRMENFLYDSLKNGMDTDRALSIYNNMVPDNYEATGVKQISPGIYEIATRDGKTIKIDEQRRTQNRATMEAILPMIKDVDGGGLYGEEAGLTPAQTRLLQNQVETLEKRKESTTDPDQRIKLAQAIDGLNARLYSGNALDPNSIPGLTEEERARLMEETAEEPKQPGFSRILPGDQMERYKEKKDTYDRNKAALAGLDAGTAATPAPAPAPAPMQERPAPAQAAQSVPDDSGSMRRGPSMTQLALEPAAPAETPTAASRTGRGSRGTRGRKPASPAKEEAPAPVADTVFIRNPQTGETVPVRAEAAEKYIAAGYEHVQTIYRK